MKREILEQYQEQKIKIIKSDKDKGKIFLTGSIFEMKKDHMLFEDKYGEKIIVDYDDVISAKLIKGDSIEL